MGSGTMNIDNATPDVPGEDVTQEFTAGAGHVVSSAFGPFIGESKLVLTAASQSIPVPPSGAAHVLIQLVGGTATDVARVSLDGTAPDATSAVLRNQEDGVYAPGLALGGNLTNIKILGTAGGSTAVFWWFK